MVIINYLVVAFCCIVRYHFGNEGRYEDQAHFVVKASAHSFKRFTSRLLNYLSLFMHLLPGMNVMPDFIWTLPVQLGGARNKWSLQTYLVHGRIRTTNTGNRCIEEGADRVRGSGRWWAGDGEEGEGGERRGGGRREKRGKEEGEGRKKGRGEKEDIIARAKRAPLQMGGGRRGGGRGKVRGREGFEAYPPVHPLIEIERKIILKAAK